MSSQEANRGSSEHCCPFHLFCIQALIKVLLFVYDIVSYIPHKIFANPEERLTSCNRKKAEPVGKGDPSSPWRQCVTNPNDVKDPFYKCNTLAQIWDLGVETYPGFDCIGTRKFISLTKEVQSDGRVFEKFELGPYRWKTFYEVDVLIRSVMKGLHAVGQKTKERVLIYSETREEFVISMIACFKSNFPVVTVYTTLGIDAVKHSINQCQPTTIFTTAKLLDTIATAVDDSHSVKNIIYFPFIDRAAPVAMPEALKSSKTNVLTFERFLDIAEESEVEPQCDVKPDDVAMIMYTSGTTGAPKGVVLLQKNIAVVLNADADRLPVSIGSTYPGYLPLAHIFEVCCELALFSRGSRVGYSSPITLVDGAPGLKKGQLGDCTMLKPTFIAGTPAVYNRIVQRINETVAKSPLWKRELFRLVYDHINKRYDQGYDDGLLASVVFRQIRNVIGGKAKYLLTAGAPINPDTHRFITICFGCSFTQGYAATETSGGGAASLIDCCRTDDIGPPELCCDIMLREWAPGGYSPHNKVPQGEVLIGGENVAWGYLNNDEQTKEAFIEMYGRRWFATGDIGEIRKDGSLRLIDRKKDLLKLSQGEYISLGKVESYLASLPFVDNVCVCGNPLKDYIVAIVVPREDLIYELATTMKIIERDFKKLCSNNEIIAKLLKDMQSFCKGKLNKMEIPRKIYLCHEIWTPSSGLVTAAFKIKRKCIEETFKDEIRDMYSCD